MNDDQKTSSRDTSDMVGQNELAGPKKAYQRPQILSREALEAVAANCPKATDTECLTLVS